MLSACAEELEEILEQCDEFIFSFAIGEEEGEEYGEVACPKDYFFGDFFGYFAGVLGVARQVFEGTHTLE